MTFNILVEFETNPVRVSFRSFNEIKYVILNVLKLLNVCVQDKTPLKKHKKQFGHDQ